jgi:putative NADH-flavin reductase
VLFGAGGHIAQSIAREALEHDRALAVYRSSGGDVDWTFISPAEEIGPDPRTGQREWEELHLVR